MPTTVPGAPSMTIVISPRACSRAHSGQLAQTAAANLLVGLRQLPAHRGPSVGAEGISGVIKKISESVGASYRTVVRGS